MRPAVFLDRDGTIIEQVHYLSDPADVRLLPGSVEALRWMATQGYARVVITNQSAIGRGMITVAQYEAVHTEMVRQLAEQDLVLEGTYYCPEAPTSQDRTSIDHPDRKPGPGMLLKAARELGLDLSRSWMVGDMTSDLLAGRNAGCAGTILVRTGYGRSIESELPPGAADEVVDDLLEATRSIPDLIPNP